MNGEGVLPAAGGDWLDYLRSVCELLWPPPAEVTLAADGTSRAVSAANRLRSAGNQAERGGSQFTLIPGLHRPPLLVPADRRAAAAAVRHQGGPRSRAARLGVRALSLGLAGGLGDTLFRGKVLVSAPTGADTIERYLKTVMSDAVQVSMYLGPARANRKPVLQLLDGAGEPAGFAKVGIDPLTRELVRTEHESLLRLSRAGLAEITIPRVLHYGRWHGLDVLVLSALSAWLPLRPLPAARLQAAMTELASVDGLWREPVAGSGYLRRLRTRLEATDQNSEQATLLRALDTLTAWAGGTALTFGCWHGDWAPWNMASTSRGLLVWDWERFTTGVPLGFDALHYRLQCDAVRSHHEPRAAADRCVQHAPRQLLPLGIPAGPARLTAILYLTDLATRYLADRQAQAGARLGVVGDWLVPAIASAVAELSAQGPGKDHHAGS